MAYNGLSSVYDRLMQDVDYDAWIDFIKQNVEISKDTLVLDAACGTGVISNKLFKCGAAVTGIDISEDMLGIASENARKDGLKVNYIAMDMCDIRSHKPVDIVTCVCDGVNYLCGLERVKAFFTSVFSVLKEGGRFIFDISSEYKLTEIIGDNFFFEDYDDLTYFWQNSIDKANGRVEMELCFFIAYADKYERFDESHVQYIYSSNDLLDLLKEVGFSNAIAYDCYSHMPISATTERITFVVEK